MTDQNQTASNETNNTLKTLDVRLDTPTSLGMLKELEGMNDVLILVEPAEQSGSAWMRESQATKAYHIHISGSETCHKLVLNADGTWHIKTIVAI